MKIIKNDDIIIYISNSYLKKVNLKNKENIETFINDLSEKYFIKLYGYYDVTIYADKIYGMIIKIKKEQLEYIDYFDEIVDMNIKIIEDTFLFKIEDILCLNKLLNKFTIRKYKDSFYLKPSHLSSIELGKVLENTTIIYGKEAENIIKKSIIIKPEVIT